MTDRRFTILLVDDEESFLSSLRRILRRTYGEGIDILLASDGMEALKVLHDNAIDLILLDLRMPMMDGFEVLREVQKTYSLVSVVILTGHGSVKDAVKAIRMGAADFLEKPFNSAEICARIDQFYKLWVLKRENAQLKEEISFTFGFEKLIGNSQAMLAVKRLITQAGPSNANVLIQGETGTGKELVARALHYHSERRHKVFVPVDCTSLSPTVVESELFGYVKGAFTGAAGSAPGLVRAADGGTIFFDEIGELPLAMQSKLLRVIQEREVRPVGGAKTFGVDVRFLAATNRDLEKEVAAGTFREDLFYRLNVIMVAIPALRDRIEDIPTLARFFLDREYGASETPGISEGALACMENYNWPGNVRELENVLRRAAALRGGQSIEIADLPPHIANFTPEESRSAGAAADARLSMGDYEQTAIRQALSHSGGNRKKAAEMLGIGEATLYRKIRKYNLG